jgi:hypothetical protein
VATPSAPRRTGDRDRHRWLLLLLLLSAPPLRRAGRGGDKLRW